MNEEKEIWKDIPNYEGYYQISSFGRVKSLERVIITNTKKKQVVKECIRKNVLIKGYCRVVFLNKQKRQNMPVHRLVAISFIENSLNKKYVNHIDGNKQNNNVSNLEWVTASENTTHSYRLGLNYKTMTENHHSAKLKNRDIPNIIKLSKNGIKQTEIAIIYKVSPSVINSIIRGRNWKHITC